MLMDLVDEEKIERTAIQRSPENPRHRATNKANSIRSIGGGDAANALSQDNRNYEERGKPSSQQSLARALPNQHSKGLRSGFGYFARTSGISSKKMVERRKKEAEDRVMKTLVVANQKGGVGKTSIIVHLAYDLGERDKKTVVIDLDPQANATFTLRDNASGIVASQLFDETPLPLPKDVPTGISLISADPGLSNLDRMEMTAACRVFMKRINELRKIYDVCLIDTAPSLGVRMAAALCVANFVISPIELETYSIIGIKKMMTTIGNIKQANPKIEFLGMVPSKVDARNPRHSKHYKELRKAYPEYIIPAPIGLRSSIPDALASRIPVWKIKRTEARKAAKELKILNQYIFKKMEIDNG